jgi:dipeptidyl aminopeptidase/acylaminoacyl peptidase
VSHDTSHAEIARRFLHEHSVVRFPRVSPDGARVAHIVSTSDLDENRTTSRIWLDGAPVTAGPHDGQPAWSHDGRWLAFTSRRGEKKGDATLHVMPVDGPGEVRTVCTLPEAITAVSWSPDDRHLAFVSRTRDERYEAEDESWQAPRKIERYYSRLNGENWIFDRPAHVYVVAADGTGSPRNLTPGEFQHADISWLPDSSGIVTSAARHDDWDIDLTVDLYLVGLDGEITALTKQTGEYRLPSVSPDGSLVAFVGADDPLTYPQNDRVGVVPLDGGADLRWISEGLDRSFNSVSCGDAPVWVDDTTVLAIADDRGTTHVHRLNVDSTPPERVTDGARVVTGFDWRSGTLATAETTVERSAELFVERDGDRQQRTDVGSAGLGWEHFLTPCSDGTDQIDAWIMRPEGFDPDGSYPVLLNVHGGPHAQYGENFFDEAQMQAAAGFVVVMSNPRGSAGRHEGWGQAIVGPKHPKRPGTGWGTVDVDDVMAVLDTVLDRYGFCDRERVGMLGGSYGGYMATNLAARHGDRFKGVCSERSVNNLLMMEWSSDIAMMFRAEHGADPIADPDEYLRMSPSTLAKDIHVPMLIIHSEDDLRCPINQAEELWVTLKWLGRDVTFYRFPGENHELSRSGSPLHRHQRAEIILDWFTDKLSSGER